MLLSWVLWRDRVSQGYGQEVLLCQYVIGRECSELEVMQIDGWSFCHLRLQGPEVV
jgi:hypothetical protein